MAGVLQEFFQVHRWVAKSCLRLCFGRGHGIHQGRLGVHHPHATAAAAASGLDDHRIGGQFFLDHRVKLLRAQRQRVGAQAGQALAHVGRAYAGFRIRGDDTRAARAALWLSREHAAEFGNLAASGGWYARAGVELTLETAKEFRAALDRAIAAAEFEEAEVRGKGAVPRLVRAA